MHHAVPDAMFRRLPDHAARDELFTLFQPLARRLARRYGQRGIEDDDLLQVAYLALVKAVNRYDPDRGNGFVSFATPTITGEIKRHFRDAGWGMGVPRRLKDVGTLVRKATDDLVQRLGRSPSVAEIAGEIGVSDEEVAEVAALGSAYRPDALDAPVPGHEFTRMDTLVAEDDRLNRLVEFSSMGPLVRSQPYRAREVLYLRFYQDLTQREIAGRLGISQMHVSRILSSTLTRLRVLAA